MKLPISLFFIISISFLNSQNVQTLVSNNSFPMNHGCIVSSDGTIFSTDVLGNGSYNGQYVFKTLSDGTTTVFASGLSGAAGLTLDNSGNLYVSELNTGRIWKVLPNGFKSIYATGTGVPAGLAFDSLGNLYVANFSYGKIMKVLPNGTVSTFANTNAEPVGIIIDSNNNLYVSHEGPHTISKITSAGIVSTLVNITGTKFQYLAFLNDDILVTGFTDHKIYRVKLDGSWSVYSGTGSSGSTNGTIGQASYDTPTGIGVTSDNNNVFIVENKKIRKISGTSLYVSDVVKPKSIKFTYDRNSKMATFNFEQVFSGKLFLYNINGKLITSITSINSQEESLNLSTMQDGIYIFNWIPYNSNVSLNGKIIKI